MARHLPVIVICAATLCGSFGAALLAAAAAPNEERACTAEELKTERVFALETSDAEGVRRASYFVELGNAQARPQVFTLRFAAEGMEEARAGLRATSLSGHQSMPLLLGVQPLPPGAKPMAPEAIAQAIRLNCRGW